MKSLRFPEEDENGIVIDPPRSRPKQTKNYRTMRDRLGVRYSDYLRLRRAGQPWGTAYPQILRQVRDDERRAEQQTTPTDDAE